jgi:hypothetical protein
LQRKKRKNAMTKHLLITAALAAGILFGAAPRAHAISPFGLMAALASDSDAEDMAAKPGSTAQADADTHDDSADDAEESAGDEQSAAAPALPTARKTPAQKKYDAAAEPAGR